MYKFPNFLLYIGYGSGSEIVSQLRIVYKQQMSPGSRAKETLLSVWQLFC